MSDDDLVAAYEGGVVGCHGAPQRDCCVTAGLDAVEQLVREEIARELAPAMLAARTAIPDGRLQRGCIVQDGAQVRERLRQAWLAIRNGPAPEVDYPGEADGEVVHPRKPELCGARGWADSPGCIRRSGHPGGHGYADGSGEQDPFPWRRTDTPEGEGWGAMVRHGQAEPPSRTAELVEQERMGFAVDWSLERRPARCVCVETTNIAELERGQRTWLPGCERHPPPTSGLRIAEPHNDDQETETP